MSKVKTAFAIAIVGVGLIGCGRIIEYSIRNSIREVKGGVPSMYDGPTLERILGPKTRHDVLTKFDQITDRYL